MEAPQDLEVRTVVPAGPIVDDGLDCATIARMFWSGVQRRGKSTILRQKELGIWRAQTWKELGAAARETAMGLAALGFAPGERASILSNTRKEWLYADLGILCAGGVSSGIYPTDSVQQVEYLMRDSGSRYLFVEDEEQLDKALQARAALPQLRKIVVFDPKGLRGFDDPQVMRLDALRALGRDYDATAPGEWEDRLRSRDAEDLAILVYTSGTTGRPKGAMISHANLIAVVRGYQQGLPQGPTDHRPCFLPLCHIAERSGGEYFALYTGTVLNFVERPETIAENVREMSPTVFTAVPRIWEKFHSAVTIAIAEATPLQRAVYRWAVQVGLQVAEIGISGGKASALLRLRYGIARLLALDNVRRAIGIHKARILITGAAPIAPDLIRWYLALGVPMLEAWGQTECSGAATVMPIDAIRPGSIGRTGPGVEIKVSPEGELLVRGPAVFMGYWNQPQKTAETIDAEGWLHTGDLGAIDEQGYVRIFDRLKDIIITAGGKNITPSEIENQLKFSPYVTDAVVIGDRRPYLTALILIDRDNVEHFAQQRAVPFSDFASLVRTREVHELIQGEVEAVNCRFARVEQVRRFRLIEQELSPEDEELTHTMKLKRRSVAQKYSDLIDSMYSETGR